MTIKLAATIGAAMLAMSSFAYAADTGSTSGGTNTGTMDGTKNDPSTTGSITNDGRSLSPQDQEFCKANPSDSKCQGLGGDMNQQ